MIRECIKHLKVITKHKYYVLKECKACGILWQGLTHDLSKFSMTEFISSAKYFQGNRSPIEAEKEDIGYSNAWLHHKGCNKHHWEYWTNFDKDGNLVCNKIPDKYIVEMVCDWIGAGKAYTKDKWTKEEPYNYYQKVKNGRHFEDETQSKVEELLQILKYWGLDVFHKRCRYLLKHGKIYRYD